MRHVKTTCFFTEAVQLRGNLSVDGSVRVDGNFSGNIVAKGTIYIGKQSEFLADAHAYQIVSEGRVEGQIRGEQNITVVSGSSLRGEIVTGELIMDEDMEFNGHCRILSPTDNPAPKIDLSAARVPIAFRDED